MKYTENCEAPPLNIVFSRGIAQFEKYFDFESPRRHRRVKPAVRAILVLTVSRRPDVSVFSLSTTLA